MTALEIFNILPRGARFDIITGIYRKVDVATGGSKCLCEDEWVIYSPQDVFVREDEIKILPQENVGMTVDVAYAVMRFNESVNLQGREIFLIETEANSFYVVGQSTFQSAEDAVRYVLGA